MRLKHGTYVRSTYEFELPYTYAYLEPMDVATISTTSIWAAGLNNVNLGIVNLPVRILKIVDDPIQGLSITAEDYPFGAHQPTIYNKQISNGDVAVNAWAEPGNAEIVMFEATSRMTGYSGNEIWIGATGVSSNYGSTNVWVSQDSTNYKQIGTITAPARMGTVASTFAPGSDPDTGNTLVVTLVENCAALDAGSNTDADYGNTLCYVGGEIISYSAVTATGQNQVTMGVQGSPATGYMRRGQMNSTIGSHSAGALFLRLDNAIFKYQYDPTWAGQTLNFKFQTVNSFGNNAQPLSSLTPVSFTVPGNNPGTIDASSGLVIVAGPQNPTHPVADPTGSNWKGAGPLGWSPVVTNTYSSVNVGNVVGGSAALPSGVHTTYFYARWVGYLVPSVTGTYTVGVNSDDGANLIIGGKALVSNLSATQAANSTLGYTQSGTISLTAGVWYSLVVEWQTSTGNYECQLAWTPPIYGSPASGGSIQLIPSGNLSTSSTTITSNLAGAWWNGSAYVWYPTGTATTAPSVNAGQFASGSMIDNAYFEASENLVPDGWQVVGNPSLAWDTTAQYSGIRSLEVTATDSGGVTTQRQYKALPGEKWKIGGYVKSDGTHTASLALLFFNASGTQIGSLLASTTSATWKYVSNTGVVPAGTAYMRAACINN
jgi:hypothetical protein